MEQRQTRTDPETFVFFFANAQNETENYGRFFILRVREVGMKNSRCLRFLLEDTFCSSGVLTFLCVLLLSSAPVFCISRSSS